MRYDLAIDKFDAVRGYKDLCCCDLLWHRGKPELGQERIHGSIHEGDRGAISAIVSSRRGLATFGERLSS